MKTLTELECGLVAGGLRKTGMRHSRRRVKALGRHGAKRGSIGTDVVIGPGSPGGGGYSGGGSSYFGGGGGGGGGGGYSGGGYSGGGYSGGGYSGGGYSGGGSGSAISAAASGGQVTYHYTDGSTYTTPAGDTLPNRDNNPLDDGQDSFSESEGSLGSDEGNAIFSNDTDGWTADVTNIFDHSNSSGVDGANGQVNWSPGQMTLGDLVNVDTGSYQTAEDNIQQIDTDMANGSVGWNTTWSSLTPQQQLNFVNAYGKSEGYDGPAATSQELSQAKADGGS